jgi:hypothetical protein
VLSGRADGGLADRLAEVDRTAGDGPVVVVGPPPVGRPVAIEPANRLHLRRPLITFPYRLYPVADESADKVCATMDTQYPAANAAAASRT